MGDLAKTPGVVALAFHVDYWDYIGWKDPYAFAGATERQRGYTTTLGSRYLYTPEMVVDGAEDTTGSDRDAVGKLIGEARQLAGKVPLAVREASEKYLVSIPASGFRTGASVWLAIFDKEHTTSVARGENQGRTLKDANVVRELRQLGRYDGKAKEIALDLALPRDRGCAVLLQADHRPGDGQGKIIGAALVDER